MDRQERSSDLWTRAKKRGVRDKYIQQGQIAGKCKGAAVGWDEKSGTGPGWEKSEAVWSGFPLYAHQSMKRACVCVVPAGWADPLVNDSKIRAASQ